MSLKFQVLTAASMKMAAFWDVAPCRLVQIVLRFRGPYCLYQQGPEGRGSLHLKQSVTLTIEAVSTFETLVRT
jgi:hypothetical protein